MIYIYALICPIDKKIKYVGKSKNPKNRYKQHIKKLDKSLTKKRLWLEELFKKDLMPEIKILAKSDNEKEARELEEKKVIENIDTVLNIHLPGKGSKTVEFYKKYKRLNDK